MKVSTDDLIKKYMNDGSVNEEGVNESLLPSGLLTLIKKIKNELQRLTPSEFEKKCKDSYKIVTKEMPESKKVQFSKLEDELDIPNNLKYNVRNESIVEYELNEDGGLSAFLLLYLKGKLLFSLSPILGSWFMFDNFLSGTKYAGTLIGLYAFFYLITISAKFLLIRKEEKKQEEMKKKYPHRVL